MASRATILKLAKLNAKKKKGGGNGESSEEGSTDPNEFAAEPLYKLELYHKDDPHYKV